jgi:hypothetical protein
MACAVLAVVGLAAGCADSDDSDRATKVEPAGKTSQGDACGLLGDDALAKLFPDDVPDPSGTSLGTGFAECEWNGDGSMVLVSMLPADDFRSDYVEQLTVSAPVKGLGDDAVSFPGLVGIGRGSADGGSVGFTSGDDAAIVAVRSSGDPTKDAAEATTLAMDVAQHL